MYRDSEKIRYKCIKIKNLCNMITKLVTKFTLLTKMYILVRVCTLKGNRRNKIFVSQNLGLI